MQKIFKKKKKSGSRLRYSQCKICVQLFSRFDCAKYVEAKNFRIAAATNEPGFSQQRWHKLPRRQRERCLRKWNRHRCAHDGTGSYGIISQCTTTVQHVLCELSIPPSHSYFPPLRFCSLSLAYLWCPLMFTRRLPPNFHPPLSCSSFFVLLVFS